jgi:hypothetical protein
MWASFSKVSGLAIAFSIDSEFNNLYQPDRFSNVFVSVKDVALKRQIHRTLLRYYE